MSVVHPRARAALPLLLLLVWAVSACDSDADTPAEPAAGTVASVEPAGGQRTTTDANENLAVGESGELDLVVHCGLRYASIDGQTWETSPRGGGSAPAGWPDTVTVTAIRTAADTVVATSSAHLDQRIVFHPVERARENHVCY